MRRLTMLLAVVVIAVSSIYADQAKLAGLGIANWMIEEDDSLIWMNPGQINYYRGLLWGELGGSATTDGWGGVSVQCPVVDKNTLAVFVSRPYSGRTGNATDAAFGSDVSAVANTTLGNAMTALTPCNKFDIFYGIPKDDLNIGVLVNSASNGYSQQVTNTAGAVVTSAKDEKVSSDFNITVGAAMKKLQLFSKVDAALTIAMPSVKNTTVVNSNALVLDDGKVETDGKLNIGLNVRGIIPMKKSNLITYFLYRTNDLSNTYARKTDNNADGDLLDVGDVNLKQSRSNSESKIVLGASINKKMSEKMTIITALHLSQTVTKLDAKTEYLGPVNTGIGQEYNWQSTAMDIPLNVAMEYILSKKVTTRLGLSRTILYSYIVDTNDPDYAVVAPATAYSFANRTETKTYSDAQASGSTVVSLGVGLNIIPGLTIDATIMERILFSGTYILSGAAVDPVGQLSLIYKFN